MIKRLLFTITATLACAAASYGQISFTAVGTGVKTFDALPVPADGWTSGFVGAGAGTITTSNQLYTAVQLVTSASVATPLPVSTTTVPPSTQNLARHNSTLFRLQIRPTGTDYTMLMATLRNDSGADVSKVTIAYEMAAMVADGSSIVEEPTLYGFKVFYSLTGAAGSWNVIPELSQSVTGTFTNNLTAVIDLPSPWVPNSSLFIIWADDNGPQSTTAPNHEGGYTIDNFSVSSPVIGVVLTSPANGADFPDNFPVVLSAAANSEGPITSIDFMEGNTLLLNDTAAPYSFSTSTLSLGSHTFTAVSHDTLGNTHTSPSKTITIHANRPPDISSVTGATTMYVGSNVTYTALATDDGAVTNVEFKVDGATRWNDPTAAFTFSWCDMVAGPHTLQSIATDYAGLKATNTMSITVTNPPDINVLLANGSAWKYWDEGTDPGVNWIDVGFNDSGWSNGIAEIGYGDTDANRPEITVSRQIVGTPGTPGAITNGAQLFRTHFNVLNPSSSTGLVVRIMADDGAVVYINGTEAARLNMPAGQTYATLAGGSTDDGLGFFDFNVPTTAIHAGDNLVAVEVHQTTLGSTDISFDLMIWGISAPRPRLTLTLQADGHYDLKWPVGSAKACLEYKESLSDAWIPFEICHPDPDATSDPGEAGFYHFGVDPAFFGTTLFFRLAPLGN